MSQKKSMGVTTLSKAWAWIKSWFVKKDAKRENFNGVSFIIYESPKRPSPLDFEEREKWFNKIRQPLEERTIKIIYPWSSKFHVEQDATEYMKPYIEHLAQQKRINNMLKNGHKVMDMTHEEQLAHRCRMTVEQYRAFQAGKEIEPPQSGALKVKVPHRFAGDEDHIKEMDCVTDVHNSEHKEIKETNEGIIYRPL